MALLHIDRKTFEDLTPYELHLAFRAYQIKEDERFEFQLDTMRLHAVAMYNKDRKEADQVIDPRKIFKFPHDEEIEDPEQEVPELTAKDWEEVDKLHFDVLKKVDEKRKRGIK